MLAVVGEECSAPWLARLFRGLKQSFDVGIRRGEILEDFRGGRTQMVAEPVVTEEIEEDDRHSRPNIVDGQFDEETPQQYGRDAMAKRSSRLFQCAGRHSNPYRGA